jgi:hypothetical protein
VDRHGSKPFRIPKNESKPPRGISSGETIRKADATKWNLGSAKIHPVRHEKTLVSQGITEKNQGLEAMRALGLEPRTQGLKVPFDSSEIIVPWDYLKRILQRSELDRK